MLCIKKVLVRPDMLKSNSTEIQKIHKFLNRLYEKADELSLCLKQRSLKPKSGSYTHHYVKFGGKLCLQRYYLPVLTVAGGGDIGVNLDGVFFEFVVPKKSVDAAKIRKLLKAFPQVEIYGLKNCLESFHDKADTAAQVLEKLEKSTERRVQFGLTFALDMPAKTIVKYFEQARALLY